MFLPAESLKKPQVGAAELAPSAQVTPVWPPVVISACHPRVRQSSACSLLSSCGGSCPQQQGQQASGVPWVPCRTI